MLVTVRNSEPQHLLVDCGKTFEEAVRQHFARLGVQGVNAVLLTHGHADAILGLDSLREVQLAREPPSQWKLKAKTPIIATNDTVKEVWSHFHYLLPENSGEPTLRRRTSCSRSVSGLSPMRVTDFQNFQAIPGLQVQTVPVLHGGTYESSGFRFGARGEFVYLSATRPVQFESAMEHRIDVRVTTLSGRELLFTLDAHDSVASLRFAAARQLGVEAWQLRLVKSGEVLGGYLLDLLEGESCLDLMAITVQKNPEVQRRSRTMFEALRSRYFRQRKMNLFCVECQYLSGAKFLERFKEPILSGDVLFQIQEYSLLELAVDNMSSQDADAAVKLMSAGGACVNAPSRGRWTPLLTACCRGLARAAASLRARGARETNHELPAALKFFEACVEHRAEPREEDVDLAKLCVELRDLEISKLQERRPVARARLLLSRAATEMALLAPGGSKLCKKDVVSRCAEGLSELGVDELSHGLWVGWPVAFLTFRTSEISEDPNTWDRGFVSARSRLLLYWRSLCKGPEVAPATVNYGDVETSSFYTNSMCYCELCFPECRPSGDGLWMEEYEVYKLQNRKWETARRNHRACRRGPVPGSGRISFSSRLAKKMPAAYRSFHVEQSLLGRKTKAKGAILREELEMEVLGL
ncbi:unnamed protein product [Effrenium voratum]|uniref:Ubiquitin-like domain-containing protein n=1 Tax=Effrenium voratum TaxID=2562239 RepID=A0AA36J4M6_9DINO|nr:unnamed protein product [Effrenium voratum]